MTFITGNLDILCDIFKVWVFIIIIQYLIKMSHLIFRLCEDC